MLSNAWFETETALIIRTKAGPCRAFGASNRAKCDCDVNCRSELASRRRTFACRALLSV